MSTDRETTRIVRSWLEEGVTALPDRVLDTVLDQVPATPQRRSWWPSRRFSEMNNVTRLAIGAAAVLAVAVLGYNLLPRSQGFGGQPTPSPTIAPSPSPSPSPSPAATPGLKTFTFKPFVGDDPEDDAITVTLQYPEGWTRGGDPVVVVFDSVGADAWAAGLRVARGYSLYSDPCRPTDGIAVADGADIEVGPTVAEFVTALDTHPLLDVTTPVDVTVGGYSGKYLVLSAPADISGCVRYRPIGGDTPYAQGPAMRWLLWVLDVQGIRVVIEGQDYPATSAQHQADLQAIVDSIQITP
jgi:hypothetical protein